MLIYCQMPMDEELIRTSGFTRVIPVTSQEINYKDVSIIRTGGKHGLGKIGELMGEVSGYILKTKMKASILLAIQSGAKMSPNALDTQ